MTDKTSTPNTSEAAAVRTAAGWIGSALTVLAPALMWCSHDVLAANGLSADAESIAQEMRDCPLWAEVPKKDFDRRNEITKAYLTVAQYPTASIRAGIALYLSGYPGGSLEWFDASVKVFALLRVVFDLPNTLPAGAHFPFQLLGNPIYPNGVVDVLWPFSRTAGGTLVLTGDALEPHTGLAPDVLAEFDRMAARLPRRFSAAISSSQRRSRFSGFSWLAARF